MKSRLARNFPSLSAPRIGDLYPSMSCQDLSGAIMPIGGRTHKFKNFDAKISGPDADGARSFLSPLESYSRTNDQERLSNIINELASELLRSGESYYEVVTIERESEESKKQLHFITGARLFRFPFIYLQLVPKPDFRDYNKRILWNWRKHVWRFTLPKEFDGPIFYRWRLFLLRLANEITPKFFSNSPFKGLKINFSVAQYNRKREMFIAKVTSAYGWDQRNLSSSNITRFYSLYRTARTRLFQSKLRSHLVDQLNDLLKTQNIDAKIEVSGLPTPDEINEILERISSGSRPYKDFNSISFY